MRVEAAAAGHETIAAYESNPNIFSRYEKKL